MSFLLIQLTPGFVFLAAAVVCAQLKREGSMGASSQSSVEGEYDVGTAIDLPPQQQQQVNPNNNTNICVFSLSLPTCLSFSVVLLSPSHVSRGVCVRACCVGPLMCLVMPVSV